MPRSLQTKLVPRNASQCLAVPRSASQCLAVPRSASQCLAVPRSLSCLFVAWPRKVGHGSEHDRLETNVMCCAN